MSEFMACACIPLSQSLHSCPRNVIRSHTLHSHHDSYLQEVVPGPKLEIHRIQRVLSSAKAISRSIPYDHVAANFQRARWGGIDDAIAYYEVNVKERTRFMSSLSLAFDRVRRSCICGG